LGLERSFADLPDFLQKFKSAPSKESKKLFLNMPAEFFLMVLDKFFQLLQLFLYIV